MVNAWVWILGGALALSLLILIGPEVRTYVRARRRRREATPPRPTPAPRPPAGPRHSADNAGPHSLSGTAILRWMEQQR